MVVDNLAHQCGSGPLVSEMCGLMGLKFLEFSHGPYCGIINRRITSPSVAAECVSLPDLVFLFLSCSPSWVGVGNTKNQTKTKPSNSIRCVGITLKEVESTVGVVILHKRGLFSEQ